jgi:hypothetical protein
MLPPPSNVSDITIYYTESFRLFPENRGDIQKNIRREPDAWSEHSEYRSKLA